MKFDELDFRTIKNAIDIYLVNAYPEGIKEKSFNIANINAFKNSNNLSEIISIFEQNIISFDDSSMKKKFTARLGSDKYPFLKLVLQEANTAGDFGFLVDRHTEYLALLGSSISYDEEKKIKEYTRILKYRIEDEFENNGIPTFRKIVKDETKKLMSLYSNTSIKHNGTRILIVDDDNDILNLLKINLELIGYTPSTASNGEDAIYKVHHEFNDLMILDLMMPEMNGFDVIKSVSSIIPILVLTALSDEQSKNDCLRNGAKGVLTKPADIYIIDRQIKKILNLVK